MNILKLIIKKIYKIMFYFIALYNKTIFQNIIFFDIDNTIADTWHSYNYYDPLVWSSEKERLISLAVFINMKKLCEELSRSHRIVFLSARSYRTFFLTKKWLEMVGLPVSLSSIILVEHAEYKLNVLASFFKERDIFYYIDDLSYNHEHGNVKYYWDVIKKIKNYNVNYLGADFIEKVNQANSQDIIRNIQDKSF
jgi:hypothetical protein